MLTMNINEIKTDRILIGDDEWLIADVGIMVWEYEPHLDEERAEGVFFTSKESKYLHASAMIEIDSGGNTHYVVSDRSFFDSEDQGPFTIYELYDTVTEYRGSDYEPFITLASDCVEAYSREYHSWSGTLDFLDSEDSTEEVEVDIVDCDHCCCGICSQCPHCEENPGE